MASPEAHARVAALAQHSAAIEAGVIPADTPFVYPVPEGPNGLPWWFGPDYQPSDQMLDYFAENNDLGSEATASS